MPKRPRAGNGQAADRSEDSTGRGAADSRIVLALDVFAATFGGSGQWPGEWARRRRG